LKRGGLKWYGKAKLVSGEETQGTTKASRIGERKGGPGYKVIEEVEKKSKLSSGRGREREAVKKDDYETH